MLKLPGKEESIDLIYGSAAKVGAGRKRIRIQQLPKRHDADQHKGSAQKNMTFTPPPSPEKRTQ